jgi:hypothetical protein
MEWREYCLGVQQEPAWRSAPIGLSHLISLLSFRSSVAKHRHISWYIYKKVKFQPSIFWYANSNALLVALGA